MSLTAATGGHKSVSYAEMIKDQAGEAGAGRGPADAADHGLARQCSRKLKVYRRPGAHHQAQGPVKIDLFRRETKVDRCRNTQHRRGDSSGCPGAPAQPAKKGPDKAVSIGAREGENLRGQGSDQAGTGKFVVTTKSLTITQRDQDRLSWSTAEAVQAEKQFDIFVNVNGAAPQARPVPPCLGIARRENYERERIWPPSGMGGFLTRDPGGCGAEESGQRRPRRRFSSPSVNGWHSV